MGRPERDMRQRLKEERDRKIRRRVKFEIRKAVILSDGEETALEMLTTQDVCKEGRCTDDSTELLA